MTASLARKNRKSEPGGAKTSLAANQNLITSKSIIGYFKAFKYP